MLNLYTQTPGYAPVFLACKDEVGNLLGILAGALLFSRKSFLKPFTTRCVLWGAPLIKSNDPDVLNILLNELDFFLRKKAIYIQFRNLNDLSFYNTYFLSAGYKWEDHLNIIIDLKQGEKWIWDNIHTSRRKQIKRSVNRGCEVIIQDSLISEDLNKCYSLLEETYKNIGLPYPSVDYFRRVFEEFVPVHQIKAFLAYFDKDIIAFRFVLTFNNLIYDWYAASDSNHKDKYPNDLLPWEIFKWGIQHRFESFDFGGAGNPNEKYGVRDYKIKFGGEVVNYGRYQKINKPILYFLGMISLKTVKLIKKILN